MKRTAIFAAGFAFSASLAAATVAFAGEETVSKVDVYAEIEDVQNANALQFWPDIETDLQAVIQAMLGNRATDDGMEMTVRIDEVSLSGSELLTGEGEFNRLQGWVYFKEPVDAEPLFQAEITVDAETGAIDLSRVEGDVVMIKMPDMPDFYTALLVGFADVAVGQIDDAAEYRPVFEENRSQSN